MGMHNNGNQSEYGNYWGGGGGGGSLGRIVKFYSGYQPKLVLQLRCLLLCMDSSFQKLGNC